MKHLLLVFLLIVSTARLHAAEPPGPAPDVAAARRVIPTRLGEKPPVVIAANDALGGAMTAFKWSGPDSAWNFPEDSYYIKLTKEDVTDFLKFFRANKAKDPYANQSWDCDDHAREALHLARLWGSRTFPRQQAAVMIGAAYVEVRDSKKPSYHVLNFIGYADGEWVWFEPQEIRIMTLAKGLKEYRVVKLQF